MAQSIEAYVGNAMDNARMGPIHWRVLGLVAAGYFIDVIDYTMFGAMTPDMIKSGFLDAGGAAMVNSVTLIGLFLGALGQGEFTDRFGRKAVYQFNLLLFGLATIARRLDAEPDLAAGLPLPRRAGPRCRATAVLLRTPRNTRRSRSAAASSR